MSYNINSAFINSSALTLPVLPEHIDSRVHYTVMLKYAGEYGKVSDASCRSCIDDAGIT